MHGRTLALLLAGLLALAAAPAADAQVPGLPPLFPPSQEEPEEPKPKPQEPEQPPQQQNPPPQQEQPKPRPEPRPSPQPPPPSSPPSGQGTPPPTPVILTVTPRDQFLGRSVEIVGRARPGVSVSLLSIARWGTTDPDLAGTARADENGIVKFRFRPEGNVTVHVADGESLSRPSQVYVVPRMQVTWQQRRGRVEALVYQEGDALAATRGDRVHFYGFTSKRGRVGRRIASSELVVAETKAGKTLVGTFIDVRYRRRLRAIAYCVDWAYRFERPSWLAGCGGRTMRF